MKRILALILILSLLFTAACVPTDSDPDPTPPETPTPAEETPQPASPDDMGAEELAELQRITRWMFEQQVLPSVIFQGHEGRDMIAAFMEQSDTDSMKELLVFFWEYTAETMITLELGDVFSPNELGLGAEHIVAVTVETLDEDWLAFIIKMYDIEQVRTSTYIGILYSETAGFRFYTLEQSYGFHMFCFRNALGRGSYFEIENDREAFIEAIMYVL